jgi:hypothetical protein
MAREFLLGFATGFIGKFHHLRAQDARDLITRAAQNDENDPDPCDFADDMIEAVCDCRPTAGYAAPWPREDPGPHGLKAGVDRPQ